MMTDNTKKLENNSKLLSWIDERFPYSETMKEHITEYYASKNFNVWYVFGVLAMVVLVIQLLTGIFLTMNYKPSSEEAFSSIHDKSLLLFSNFFVLSDIIHHLDLYLW